MARIHFQDRDFPVLDGETVLTCLERHGAEVPSSCRSGVCQSCLLEAVEGDLPAAAQEGLRDTWKQQGYFLACACRPTGDLEVRLPGEETTCSPTQVVAKEALSEDVLRLRLEVPDGLSYRAGQFVSLVRDDGLVRPYSLASVPDEDDTLELHVRVVPGGSMTTWMRDALTPGTKLSLRGPAGSCFYVPAGLDERLLLAGTSTGVAPLVGIVRDALRRGHRGRIDLYFGSVVRRGLYLLDELRARFAAHDNVRVHACVLEGEDDDGVRRASLESAVLEDTDGFSGARAFLCGHPDLVRALQKKLFLAGVSLGRIHADPFLSAAR